MHETDAAALRRRTLLQAMQNWQAERVAFGASSKRQAQWGSSQPLSQKAAATQRSYTVRSEIQAGLLDHTSENNKMQKMQQKGAPRGRPGRPPKAGRPRSGPQSVQSFPCDKCDRVFNRPQSLSLHRRGPTCGATNFEEDIYAPLKKKKTIYVIESQPLDISARCVASTRA